MSKIILSTVKMSNEILATHFVACAQDITLFSQLRRNNHEEID